MQEGRRTQDAPRLPARCAPSHVQSDVADFQRQHGMRSHDSAQRAVRTLRMAITRLHQHLMVSLDIEGNPHSVLPTEYSGERRPLTPKHQSAQTKILKG